MAKLTFVLEDGQEIVVPLAEHITIGRGEDNDVVVDDDRVSKHHAELVSNADGSIQLFDSNSTAGTFVNGERVRSQTIMHGDRLAFGPLTAVLDLEEIDINDTNGSATDLALPGSDTQALTIDTPVKAGKIGTRKKNRGGKKDFPDEEHQARLQAEHQAAIARFEEEKARLQAEHQAAIVRFEEEKSRLQKELEALQKELREWQERSDAERTTHHARVESLRAEEKRLTPVKTAVREAEAAHAEWLKSIQALATRHEEQTAAVQRLTAQHDQKTVDLQLLATDEAAARHELEVLATHRDQALTHLQQIRAECVQDETALADLRRQVADLETRSQHSKEIAEVREDQLKAAEKKLEQLSHQRVQIEAHIHELTGTEEKLVQARAHCREAETQHATLTAAIAALGLDQQRSAAAVKELESLIATLQESHQQADAATKEAGASRQRAEESLQHLQDEIASRTKDLATRNAELTVETQRLEDVPGQGRRSMGPCRHGGFPPM